MGEGKRKIEARHFDVPESLFAGTLADPHSVLGIHEWNGGKVVRVYDPLATSVELLSGRVFSNVTGMESHGNGLFTALLLGSESIQSRMSHLGNAALLYHQVKEVDEIIAEYDAVTREQLRTLAQEMFRFDHACLSAVGKVKTIAQYSRWLGK